MKHRVKVLNKVVLFVGGIILIMGLDGCSFENQGGGTGEETIVESQTTSDESRENVTPETEAVETPSMETEAVEASSPEAESAEMPSVETEVLEIDVEEIPQGDPVVGTVDQIEDNEIVIRDGDDEDLVYRFLTQEAQVTEGDSPIGPGDIVEITYKGFLGDEENPGIALKINVISQ